MMKLTPGGEDVADDFHATIIPQSKGMCLCVCVCMCMIITLMFRAFWRDCVRIVESPPPSLVVSFPLSWTAASEIPSSLLHFPYMLSFKPPSAHSPSFALSRQCWEFSHSIVFFSLQSLPLLWSLTDMHYNHELKIGVCLPLPLCIHILSEQDVSLILGAQEPASLQQRLKNKLKLITWIVLMSTVSIM